MKVLPLTIQKIWPMLKFLQKNIQTGQKHYMPPIFRLGDIKKLIVSETLLQCLCAVHLRVLIVAYDQLQRHMELEVLSVVMHEW
jgi:hypothetical protein